MTSIESVAAAAEKMAEPPAEASVARVARLSPTSAGLLGGLTVSVVVILIGMAVAQPRAQLPGAPATAPGSIEPAAADQESGKVSARFVEKVGTTPTAVRPAPFGNGLFEVLVNGDVLYVDGEVNYLFSGRVFDVKTRSDLTQARKDDVNRIDFAALPLEQAVKVVRGTGARKMAVFADPNCRYCQSLEKTLAEAKDVTIYTFLVAMLGPDSAVKAAAVWCAPDRAAAWSALMLEGKVPAAAPADCKSPLTANAELGRRFGVSGTPTMFFPNGKRAVGAQPLAQVQSLLDVK